MIDYCATLDYDIKTVYAKMVSDLQEQYPEPDFDYDEFGDPIDDDECDSFFTDNDVPKPYVETIDVDDINSCFYDPDIDPEDGPDMSWFAKENYILKKADKPTQSLIEPMTVDEPDTLLDNTAHVLMDVVDSCESVCVFELTPKRKRKRCEYKEDESHDAKKALLNSFSILALNDHTLLSADKQNIPAEAEVSNIPDKSLMPSTSMMLDGYAPTVGLSNLIDQNAFKLSEQKDKILTENLGEKVSQVKDPSFELDNLEYTEDEIKKLRKRRIQRTIVSKYEYTQKIEEVFMGVGVLRENIKVTRFRGKNLTSISGHMRISDEVENTFKAIENGGIVFDDRG